MRGNAERDDNMFSARLVTLVVAFFAVSAFLSAVDVQELGTGIQLLGGHVRCVACLCNLLVPLTAP